MLNPREIRENSSFIEEGLNRRGLKVNLDLLKAHSKKLKELEQQRSNLQAEGNAVGKEVGKQIKAGKQPNGDEVALLRNKGNSIKTKVNLIEEEEKTLKKLIKEQILHYPNIPYSDCPDGENEKDNIQIRTWGNPLVGKDYKEHWQIAEE